MLPQNTLPLSHAPIDYLGSPQAFGATSMDQYYYSTPTTGSTSTNPNNQSVASPQSSQGSSPAQPHNNTSQTNSSHVSPKPIIRSTHSNDSSAQQSQQTQSSPLQLQQQSTPAGQLYPLSPRQQSSQPTQQQQHQHQHHPQQPHQHHNHQNHQNHHPHHQRGSNNHKSHQNHQQHQHHQHNHHNHQQHQPHQPHHNPHNQHQSQEDSQSPSAAQLAANQAALSITQLNALLHTPAPPADRNPPASSRNDANANLYIRNLPSFWNVNDLTDFYSHFGDVRSACVLTDPTTKKSKCVGFVRFGTTAQAEQSVNATNGVCVQGGGPLVTRFAHVKSREEKTHERQIKKLQFEHMTTGSLPEHLPEQLLEQVQRPMAHFKQTFTLDQPNGPVLQIDTAEVGNFPVVTATSRAANNNNNAVVNNINTTNHHNNNNNNNNNNHHDGNHQPRFSPDNITNNNNNNHNNNNNNNNHNLTQPPQGYFPPYNQPHPNLHPVYPPHSFPGLQPSQSTTTAQYNHQLLHLAQLQQQQQQQHNPAASSSPTPSAPQLSPQQRSTQFRLFQNITASGCQAPSFTVVCLHNITNPNAQTILNVALSYGPVKSIHLKSGTPQKIVHNEEHTSALSPTLSSTSTSGPLLSSSSSSSSVSPQATTTTTTSVESTCMSAYIVFFDFNPALKMGIQFDQVTTNYSTGPLFTDLMIETDIPIESALIYVFDPNAINIPNLSASHTTPNNSLNSNTSAGSHMSVLSSHNTNPSNVSRPLTQTSTLQ